MRGKDNAVWTIEGSDEIGWYMEGRSKKYAQQLSGQGHSDTGWFCMEVETFAEVTEQLQELGLIKEVSNGGT